ncbi:capsular polysaccharide biosynthesis protein [Rhizocola hellebori]|uniref:Capsular polysaccharide biosynthesis protein n=1 Tax=Rhizocola hellebori TaxID=1392758 RepID=A0A8J3Q7K3_9ACTN|nr:CapA family protein [Rhizocola hellebori]GIH04733.1 capsular polysaccharide biosynthesis protein [Rhizocola hellebori]
MPASTTAPAAQPPPSTSSAPRDITLAFGGDVHFSGRTLSLLDNPQTAFGRIGPVLSRADLAFVNLETAVTERGTPEPKEFHFRAPASAYAAVKAAGIDAVSIANNHTLDYGQTGLADTLDYARQSGIPALGGGPVEQAYQPWITEVRGTRIAVVALSHVDELWQSWEATDTRPGLAMLRNPLRALAAVRQARAQADVVVVMLHWGPEYQECPTAELKTLAAQLIEAGADLLVGGHQHLLLGAGWQGKAYVAYGMGNFLWWRNDALSNDTGVLWVTIRDRKVAAASLVPAYIDRATGQPYPVDGEAAARIMEEQKRLRACAGLAEHPGN